MLIFNIGMVAKLLGVHRNTVTNWINSKKLAATPGAAKRYTIAKEEFIRFCEDRNISKEIMAQIIAETSAPRTPAADKSKKPSIVAQDTTDSSNIDYHAPKGMAPLPGTKKRMGSVLVVGGGISGIQAALELADSDFYVYLLEKTAGLGGVMSQLDKTFPTNDCASCIILPKLVACERHLNIEIITLADIESVRGGAGHFQVRVKKNPRFVDTDKCIACGMCAQKCPINVPDEFNLGISKRKAVYIKYDQTIPLKYAIDPLTCIYFTLDRCKVCEKFCPTGAINFEQKPESITLDVGAVILAPGFKPFDPSRHDFLGHHRIEDVVTSLEFERLLSISGPNKGRLLRPSDQTPPQKIAWLQCVGSRNHNNCGNSYCSNICCMSAVKQSMMMLEHALDQEQEQTIFFTDLRSQGKEAERYFMRAKEMHINFVRAIPHTMEPGPNHTGVRVRYMTEQGKIVKALFDLVVLSIGFEAPGDAAALARMFNVGLDRHHFAATSCFDPIESSQKGVFVIGAFQSPKAISRAVTQSAAAAASAARQLADQRGVLTRIKTYPDERDITAEEPVVGVFVCSCGVNIAGIVDVDQVVSYAARLPHVAYAENNLFSCSADAQESISDKIKEFGLNRIVIAACTPRTHEPLFQETLKNARLNGFMVEMANIRNQNAWVHQKDADHATRKAKDQVRMAIAKVVHNYPLIQERILVEKRALVLGGGLVGLDSALTLARLGIDTVLIEKSGVLGGNALKLETSFKGENVSAYLENLIRQVHQEKRITVRRRATLESVSGSVGNFKGTIRIGNETEEIRFGAAIMATGGKEAVPDEYLYGGEPRVMTQLEFDRKVLIHPDEVKKTDSVVFIQCVGSREPQRPYCSRVCCIHSVRTAIRLKQVNPAIKITVIYREISTYGEWEGIYKQARGLGVIFIRYQTIRKPKVKIKDHTLLIELFDPIAGRPVRIVADYLSLATGVVSGENQYLADSFRFSVDSDGFFNGAHPKLKPVDLSVAGLFLAGLCNYPKPLDESIEEARAAAFRASALLLREEIQSEAVKAFVTRNCDGCALCVDVCPFHAITIVREENLGQPPYCRIVCDPALCQGCGICAATCPKDGIRVHGFTMEQLTAQVRSAVDRAPVDGEEKHDDTI